MSSNIEDILGFSIEDIITESFFSTEPEVILKGELTKDLIIEISRYRKEPEWMLKHRLRALEWFHKLPFPNWLKRVLSYAKVSLDLSEYKHYIKPKDDNVSKSVYEILNEFYTKVGISPSSLRTTLFGELAQLDSEVVYKRVKELLESKGVVIESLSEMLDNDIVRENFGRIFPMTDHKFAALHHAIWSGGIFVYVPENVKIPWTIEAMFIISQELESQAEHTLIIADKNSQITFLEGCIAPLFKNYSFHDGMIEILAKDNADVRFLTSQNWSKNVINFNNKRAIAYDKAKIRWVEISVGSKLTVTYPSTILKGNNSSTEILSISLAKGNIVKDTGGKVIHIGKNTMSKIISKSVSSEGGLNIYRGMVNIMRGALNARNSTTCDSLILDKNSKSITIPHDINNEPTAEISHEATTFNLSDEKIYYLRSKGLSEEEAKVLIVTGYLKSITRELRECLLLPAMLKKIIELDFSKYGSVG